MPPKPTARHVKASDLRAIAQLATQATRGVTQISEGVHQAVWSSMGMPGGKVKGKARGITGLVYQCIHGITQLVGSSLDRLFLRLLPVLEVADHAAPESFERAAVVAALNGVLGDRLARDHNPLACTMDLRLHGKVIGRSTPPAISDVTPKVVVFIHGLCMNDLQWKAARDATGDTPLQSDYGATLSDRLGYTPVYLRYNTGLHTSENGALLADQLTQLLNIWPIPITEVSVIAHSMGGLVTRSAYAIAIERGLSWTPLLKRVAFLGTPHHGAPLERAGNWVDVLLGSNRYSAPFATLGKLRSAGITDLRFGHVLESDWLGHDRFRRKPDSRTTLPLPDGVACYCVAATLVAPRSPLAQRLAGDGLVPLRSALGQHDVATRNLNFSRQSQQVCYRMNHMELLNSPAISTKLLEWFSVPLRDYPKAS